MPKPLIPHIRDEKSWNEEHLYFEAKSYYDRLLSDLNQAHDEIILETYIFKLDSVGKQVLEALESAAKRGVRIKLLIDGAGSSEDAETIAYALHNPDLPRPNVEVRIYHPLPWNFSAYRWALRYKKKKQKKFLEKLWHFITQVNHRNHRKLCIIDERIAWLGSFNITREHEHHNWHDSAVRLIGEPIANLKNNFFHVWQRRDRSSRRHVHHFLTNHSLKLRKQKNARLVKIIQQAKTRIWITNAYFSPSNTLLRELKAAVTRGVSVRVIVPSRSDVAIFPAITRTFYADLLAAKLQIYELNTKILHSKTMLIDNQLIIGSTNLNYRSYFHDLELDAILSKPETIHQMEQKFIFDKSQSEEITLHTMKKFPRLVMMVGWFSRLLRYWL